MTLHGWMPMADGAFTLYAAPNLVQMDPADKFSYVLQGKPCFSVANPRSWAIMQHSCWQACTFI